MRLSLKKPKPRNDEELMLLVQKNDPEAFSMLYDRYAGRMVNFFYLRLGYDEPKAQDFLHDLFVKILQNPFSYAPGNNFRSWLFTLAMNMCKNEYRSQQVREEYRLFVKSNVTGISEENHVAIDMKLFGRELLVKLELLPVTQREVFLLRYREELSIAEISEVMGIPEGTVKSRLFHTLRILALHLKKFDPVHSG